jgi:hypothetical protein
MSGIAPKQNAFKFKIAPHKPKSIVKIVLTGRGGPLTNEAPLPTRPSYQRGPLTNEALCLSTPKHNGKSGTDY